MRHTREPPQPAPAPSCEPTQLLAKLSSPYVNHAPNPLRSSSACHLDLELLKLAQGDEHRLAPFGARIRRKRPTQSNRGILVSPPRYVDSAASETDTSTSSE